MSLHQIPDVSDETSATSFLKFVRQNSPFYAKLWEEVENRETHSLQLTDLPITDHEAFWAANSCLDSQVITTSQQDGIIFKTGGTTAHPKVSFYSHLELKGVSNQLASCLTRCGVRRGDRIANLFYAGELWGSFLLHVLSVYHLPDGAVQLPVAGHIELGAMQSYIMEFEANVLLSTVTTMCQLAERIVGEGKTYPFVRLLLFSGEGYFDDQAALLKAAFPSAKVKSVVYGSMDCGVIGVPLLDESYHSDPRVHQVNISNIVVEIVKDDGQMSTTPGEEGSLIVTNLERRLMPVVRYPSSDRAEWVDYQLGIFRLLGRDSAATRLGPVSVDFVDLRRVVINAMSGRATGQLQAVITREDRKDTLTLLIAYQPTDAQEAAALKDDINRALNRLRPMFREHVKKNLINPLQVKFVTMQGLIINSRSGKAKQIIDVRSTTMTDPA